MQMMIKIGENKGDDKYEEVLIQYISQVRCFASSLFLHFLFLPVRHSLLILPQFHWFFSLCFFLLGPFLPEASFPHEFSSLSDDYVQWAGFELDQIGQILPIFSGVILSIVKIDDRLDKHRWVWLANCMPKFSLYLLVLQLFDVICIFQHDVPASNLVRLVPRAIVLMPVEDLINSDKFKWILIGQSTHHACLQVIAVDYLLGNLYVFYASIYLEAQLWEVTLESIHSLVDERRNRSVLSWVESLQHCLSCMDDEVLDEAFSIR